MNSTGSKSTLATGITAMSAVIVKMYAYNAQSKFTQKLNIHENEEKDFFRNLWVPPIKHGFNFYLYDEWYFSDQLDTQHWE